MDCLKWRKQDRIGGNAMHIIEKIRVDKYGRLLLTKVFEEVPRIVLISFDTKTKRLYFYEAKAEEKNARRVDEKGRVCLPKWAIEKLGREYYVCMESPDEHCVLPSKFLFVE